MSRARALTVALLALLALLIAACTDDEPSAGGPPPAPVDTGDRDAFCDAYDRLVPMVESVADHSIADARTDLAAILEIASQVDESAPAQLAGDAATMMEGLATLHRLATEAATIEDFRAAALSLDAQRFDAAGRAIEAWTETNC